MSSERFEGKVDIIPLVLQSEAVKKEAFKNFGHFSQVDLTSVRRSQKYSRYTNYISFYTSNLAVLKDGLRTGFSQQFLQDYSATRDTADYLKETAFSMLKDVMRSLSPSISDSNLKIAVAQINYAHGVLFAAESISGAENFIRGLDVAAILDHPDVNVSPAEAVEFIIERKQSNSKNAELLKKEDPTGFLIIENLLRDLESGEKRLPDHDEITLVIDGVKFAKELHGLAYPLIVELKSKK